MLFPELHRKEVNSMKVSKAFFVGLLRRLFFRRIEKVFILGFHKTGTSTMGKALQILGYKVCGSIKEAADVDKFEVDYLAYIFNKADSLLNNYDAFQDTPWFLLYKELYEEYPRAKFILTVRDSSEWIKSIQKHFRDNNFAFHLLIYGTLDTVKDEKIYLERYENHNEEVKKFFNDNNNFLELKLEKDFSWDLICSFLNLNKPLIKFPHANKSMYRKSLISKIKQKLKSFYYH